MGRVLAAGVDDVLSGVRADVFAYPGHQGSEQVAGTDDEAQLLAGMERKLDQVRDTAFQHRVVSETRALLDTPEPA